jgi:hypothetical protein
MQLPNKHCWNVPVMRSPATVAVPCSNASGPIKIKSTRKVIVVPDTVPVTGQPPMAAHPVCGAVRRPVTVAPV